MTINFVYIYSSEKSVHNKSILLFSRNKIYALQILNHLGTLYSYYVNRPWRYKKKILFGLSVQSNIISSILFKLRKLSNYDCEDTPKMEINFDLLI